MLQKISNYSLILFLAAFSLLVCFSLFGWKGNSENMKLVHWILVYVAPASFILFVTTAIMGGYKK